MELGFPVHFAKDASGLDPSRAVRRIHEDPLHPGHVEGQTALRHGGAGDVVAAAFDGEEEAAAPREVHTLDHVRRPGRSDDECRPSIDHPVP